ncbi:MAG TPA: exodeoxyribonuclease VII large subunit, partial [Thermoanaerobaculia bacterium]|nr:exodeoxyribonuclease VII large subunit [Thermoanaerobaculia bacterium]
MAQGFPSIWVVGEIQRLKASQRGHLYFELVEKGERDEIVGKIDAVAWRSDHQRIRHLLEEQGQHLADGQQIRCRGGVDFYPAGGRLQLVVRDVDPVFTLGMLERRRRETLAALEAAGKIGLNRKLPLSPIPLSVALITSQGSAAYHDFLSVLEASGLAFSVLLLHAAVQGKEAEREISSALNTLPALSGIDCAVLIRGGGSRSDLAAFDSRVIAEAICAA